MTSLQGAQNCRADLLCFCSGHLPPLTRRNQSSLVTLSNLSLTHVRGSLYNYHRQFTAESRLSTHVLWLLNQVWVFTVQKNSLSGQGQRHWPSGAALSQVARVGWSPIPCCATCTKYAGVPSEYRPVPVLGPPLFFLVLFKTDLAEQLLGTHSSFQ